VQGGGVNESESWALAMPPDAPSGRAMLLALQTRLPYRELMLRSDAIAAAKAFIDRCEAAGGITAPVRRSFLVPGDRTNRRVDIEVISGVAFTPLSPAAQQGSAS
jgi:hypothetical protein